MFVASMSNSLSLIFIGQDDLKLVIKHLTDYLEHSESADEIFVYTVSDNRLPSEETQYTAFWLKSIIEASRDAGKIQVKEQENE